MQVFPRENWLETLTLISSALAAVFLVGGCSSVSQQGGTSTEETKAWSEITQTEFDSALASLRVTKDEFNGQQEIFGEIVSSKYSTEQDKKLIMFAHLTKAKDEPLKFRIATGYKGQEFLFHSSFDLKSSKGVFSKPVDTSSREDETVNGTSMEFAGTLLSHSEVLQYCSVISGNQVRFRYSGRKGITVTSNMTQKSHIDNINTCKVYFGLEQGLSTPML